jgi:hypothetical protein
MAATWRCLHNRVKKDKSSDEDVGRKRRFRKSMRTISEKYLTVYVLVNEEVGEAGMTAREAGTHENAINHVFAPKYRSD